MEETTFQVGITEATGTGLRSGFEDTELVDNMSSRDIEMRSLAPRLVNLRYKGIIISLGMSGTPFREKQVRAALEDIMAGSNRDGLIKQT